MGKVIGKGVGRSGAYLEAVRQRAPASERKGLVQCRAPPSALGPGERDGAGSSEGHANFETSVSISDWVFLIV